MTSDPLKERLIRELALVGYKDIKEIEACYEQAVKEVHGKDLLKIFADMKRKLDEKDDK